MRALAFLPGVETIPEPEAGRLVRLPTDSEFRGRSGVYVGSLAIKQPTAEATDPDIRRELWERSATLVGVEPSWP